MLLRESSLSTILQKDGAKRSSKGCAPTQTESDQAAYGSRKAKVYGASLQTDAWDANALLQAPLYCAIRAPLPKERRSDGEFGDPSWLRDYLHRQEAEQRINHADERLARRKLEGAAASALARDAIGARV